MFIFFFQAEDGIRDLIVTGVQTCALPIFAQLVGAARVVEDPLGSRRLPGIDVGHDADVPNVVERGRPWHCVPRYSKNAGRPGARRWAGLAPLGPAAPPRG